MPEMRKTLSSIIALIIIASIIFIFLSENKSEEFPPLPPKREEGTIPVILTVDTEFDPDSVKYLTKLFKHYGVKATFFILGEFAEGHKSLIEEIDYFGNEVACHSYSHPHFSNLTKEEKLEEISRCTDIIKDIVEKAVYGFRVPYLEYDEETLLILRDLNLVYDSSKVLLPGEKTPCEIFGIKEIPISTFFDTEGNLRLIEDITLYNRLNLTDDEAKELLKNTYEIRKSEHEPMVVMLHAHIIGKHQSTLVDFLNYTYADGASFITCKDLLQG